MANVIPFRSRNEPDGEGDMGDTEGVTPDTQEPPGTDLEPLEGQVVPAGRRKPDVVYATVTARPEDMRAIVPGWMKTRQGRRATLKWWVRLQWHRLWFHLVRAPGYVTVAAWRVPVGAWRVCRFVGSWVLDSVAEAMEQDLASAGKVSAKEFQRLREQRSDRVKARSVLLVLGLLAAAVAGLWVAQLDQPAVHAIVLVTLAGLLARAGGKGRPLAGPAMATTHGHRELTDAILMRALRAAGLGGQAAKVDKDGVETQEDTRATLAQPIQRAENGSGYLCDVYLPWGKTVEDAAANTEKIASGLDVDAPQVIVEAVKGNTRRVVLYVADEDPFSLPPRRSPMARLPKVSVWDAHPVGCEPRGREARPSLIFNSFLIGAIPRSGKTFAARVLTAPGLLDPHCDITVLDFKGGKDWKAVEDLAVTFNSGDNDDDLDYGLAVLGRLKRDAQARFKAFQDMTDQENPEGKLTRELGRGGYRPHLVVIDEVQNLLRASDKRIQKEALELLIWLAKTAPAAGYSLVMATQRPAAEVIPADLRDNTSVRLALRTKTWQSSDAILGAGINSIGYGTQRFLEEHQGAAVLGGVSNGRGGDLAVIRTDLLTLADFAKVCAMGRQRRLDAGTLRTGEGDVQVTVSVLDDVANVWPEELPKVQAHLLVTRLRELLPACYAGLDEAGLTRALGEFGVPVAQVKRDGTNRNGYSLDAVKRASARQLER